MKRLKKKLMHFISHADDLIDTLRFRFKRRFRLFDPLYICAYHSYGTTEMLSVRGRVLENKNITTAEDDDTLLENAVNMYKRFQSAEVPGAHLQVHFEKVIYHAITDKEGYFEINIFPMHPIPDQLWHDIEVELVKSPVPYKGRVTATARVMVPGPKSSFGIISDIDDTIIESFATSRLKMFRTVMLKNSRTRSPFEGVSAFYRALQKGHEGQSENPFFYVSSSPWNLYDFLLDFLDINKIPEGPLLLKDLGVEKDKFVSKKHKTHKLEEIINILSKYPRLPFILIGDSGQKDPVIYQEVVKRFPDRILAIYIRDVELPKRAKIVIDIAEKMGEERTPMILIENTVKAAEHAITNQYIPAGSLQDIQRAKEKDVRGKKKTVKKGTEEVKAEVEKELRKEPKQE